MKGLSLLILMLLLTGVAAGQTPATESNPHGVEVVQARWHKQFYIPALDEDPMLGSDATTDAQRQRKEANKAAEARNKGDRVLYRLPAPAEAPGEPANKRQDGSRSTVYVYEVKVSNGGMKKIRSIVWDYVLFDPATQRDVGNHPFETKIVIHPGKSKSLRGTTTSPPATVVDVSKSNKEAHGQYSERIDIRRVEYDDGTFWERSPDN